jgi:hypothetical protein
MYNWQECFPKNYVPRKQQIIGIEFALNTFLKNNKKYCIL